MDILKYDFICICGAKTNLSFNLDDRLIQVKFKCLCEDNIWIYIFSKESTNRFYIEFDNYRICIYNNSYCNKFHIEYYSRFYKFEEFDSINHSIEVAKKIIENSEFI